MTKIEGFTIKYYDTTLFCDGIILFWLKEIHINKKWKNTPLRKEILTHELTHLKFINKIKKIQKDKKMNKILQKLMIVCITLANNIFDEIDCNRLWLSKIKYERLQKRVTTK